MTIPSFRRAFVWLVIGALGAIVVESGSRVAKRYDVSPWPMKDEKRRVQAGPDSPDLALQYIQIAMRDENGNIDPNGLMNARRQVDAMRARARQQRLAAAASGEPDSIAGVNNASWTWIGPGNIGGRTRAIAINPADTNTIFVGSVAGGIWKTTNGGGTWNFVDDFMANLAVTCILYQPGNTSIMYASTGEGFGNQDSINGAGIFKSVDGGTTWNQLASTANANFALTVDLAISADGSVLLAATSTGIWRSTDGGATFPASGQGKISGVAIPNVQDVKFLPGSSSEAVIGGRAKNVYFTQDGASTWQTSTGLPGESTNVAKRVELAVSPSSPNVVYASVAQGGVASTPPAEIWKSTDNGHSYSMVAAPASSLLGAQGWYDNTIWVDPADSQHVLVGGVSISRSLDGGVTFAGLAQTPFAVHSDHHIFLQDPNYNGTTNRRVYFGGDGGLYKIENLTTSSPQTVTRLNNNYGVTQFYGGASVTTGKIFGGTQDNGTLIYTGDPQNWFAINGSDGGFAAGDQTNPLFLYGETQNLGVHRSSNGGGPNSSVLITNCGGAAPLGDACTPSSNFIAPILLDPNEPNRLFAGGSSLWRTNDARTLGGPSWSAIKVPNGSFIANIAVTPGNSDRIWVGHNNGDVFLTSDGTSATPTWTKVDLSPGLPGGPPDRAVTSIQLDPVDPNIAYVSFGGFGPNFILTGNVWKTVDSGASWQNISGSGGGALPAAPVRWIIPHPSVAGWLYAATDVGLFTSENGGASWNLPQDGPANVAVFNLFWMGNTLVAVTHGRGMFTANVASPATPPSLLSQPQSQAIAMGASVTLSTSASGSVPITYQWYRGASGNTAVPLSGATSATFTTPQNFFSASFWVRATNPFGSVDSATATLTPQNGIATYDPSLRVPRCGIVGTACDTGASLILGRDNMNGGPELNQPNTINNSCADGTSGTFHVNESIDSIKISNTAIGAPLTVGATVKIDVGVWVTSTTNDRLDLFGAANASSPVWTFIATITPGATGAQTLTNSSYVLPAGGLQAIRAHFRNSGGSTSSICGTGTSEDHDDLAFAVTPASGVEMIQNGGFASGTANWLVWEVPDIISSVASGVFQFFLANPQTTTSKQATVFQNTGLPVVSGAPLLASFQLGNSSTVRKRISVLVLDSDFSDISVCTFWIPPNQIALKTYLMRMHTTKGWSNASIYFYAATAGANGGNYLVDNVSLKYTPAQATDRTDCVDPNAPNPSLGAASANLLVNGDFSSGALLPGWSAVVPISVQITGGVLEFLRPNNITPAGVVMQATAQTAVANQAFNATFALGNSSTVPKRVTVLLHDLDLSTNPDLMACTFVLPPGLALSNYTIKGFATQAWANATISFYPATVGLEQWIRLDNVTFNKVAPSASVIGTECIEPNTIAFPVAFPGSGRSGASVASFGSAREITTPVRADGTPVRPLTDGLRLADEKPLGENGLGWQVEAGTTRQQILRLGDAIDLTTASQASLSFSSRLSATSSSAEVQVSFDGVTWETLTIVPPFGTWMPLDLDLGAYLGQTVYLQFVFDAVAPPAGAPADTWRIDNVVVARRGVK